MAINWPEIARCIHWGLSAGLALVGLALVPWRPLALLVLGAAMLVQGGLETIEDIVARACARSYFGIYTVRDYPEPQAAHARPRHHAARPAIDRSGAALPADELLRSRIGVGSRFANASRLFPLRASWASSGWGPAR
jgi:hypothetical protein